MGEDSSSDRRLHKLARKRGHADAVSTFLKSEGVPVDSRDDRGRTALFGAAFGSDPETVRALINAGADPNATDNDARTPLHMSALSGNVATAAALLERGALPASDGETTPLDVALAEYSIGVASLLSPDGLGNHFPGASTEEKIRLFTLNLAASAAEETRESGDWDEFSQDDNGLEELCRQAWEEHFGPILVEMVKNVSSDGQAESQRSTNVIQTEFDAFRTAFFSAKD